VTAKFIVVVSLVIERDGKVLVARRSLDSEHAPGTWEGISGRLEAGESPIIAVHREALEETGLTVEVIAPIDTFHFYRGDAREDAIGMTFHCKVGDGQPRLSREHDQFVWITLKQLANYSLPDGLKKCIRCVLEKED
jgi:8-oxo-dGTP diphosphatase